MTNDKNFFIHETAIIGDGPRFLQSAVPWDLENIKEGVDLPKSIYIGPFAIIGHSVILGEGVVIDAYCRIEPLAEIGDNSLVLYRATVGVMAKIGRECVIGGSVSENTVVEDRSRSFGKLIHRHEDSTRSWDFCDHPEASPIIKQDSFVGHDATIIGGIKIGPFAYVCAGATVTRDVPPYHIARGNNEIIHKNDWSGKLKNNPIFKRVR